MNFLNKSQSLAVVLIAAAVLGCNGVLSFPYLNWAAVSRALPQIQNSAQIVLNINWFMPIIGAFVLGWIGDSKGTKYAIALSMFLTAMSAIGSYCVPFETSTGNSAPVLLFGSVALQDFAIGGGAAAIVVFLLNAAQPTARGRYISQQFLSGHFGALCASFISLAVVRSTPYDFLRSYDWRAILLLTGALALILSAISVWLVDDPVVPTDQAIAASRSARPLLIRNLICGWIILTVVQLSSVVLIYSTPVAVGSDRWHDFLWRVSSSAIVLVGIAIGGWASDSYGRKRVLLTAGILMVPSMFVPMFLQHVLPSEVLLATLLIAAASRGAFISSSAVAIVEAMPSNLRVQGWALLNAIALLTSSIVTGPGGRTLLNGDVVFHALICVAAIFAIQAFSMAPQSEASADMDAIAEI